MNVGKVKGFLGILRFGMILWSTLKLLSGSFRGITVFAKGFYPPARQRGPARSGPGEG